MGKKTSSHYNPSSEVNLNERKGGYYSKYINKFYNLWMHSIKLDGLEYEESEFVKRKLWEVGTVTAFSLLPPLEIVAFAQSAYDYKNMYGFPSRCHIVNENMAPMLPTHSLTVIHRKEDMAHEDKHASAVIGWATHSHEPISLIANRFALEMTDVRMTYDINLMSLKVPWVLRVGPESGMKAKDIIAKIINNTPMFVMDDGDGVNSGKMESGAPFILDKLKMAEDAMESEFLSYIGIDNLSMQKQERMVVDEANSNNEVINQGGEAILENLTAFFETVKLVFGKDVKVSSTAAASQSVHEEINEAPTDEDKKKEGQGDGTGN